MVKSCPSLLEELEWNFLHEAIGREKTKLDII
jgi:hypothetical protein